MSILREIPPTAGFPLYLKDFWGASQPASLKQDFRNYLGLDYARVTYSGTAAFYLILESLKKISPKKTVVIPSFVCPLVPLAIARAGLRVEVCDIKRDSFDFDYLALENICAQNSDILAVVAVHLAGIPIDLDSLEKVTKKYGIFIIEDCAQSLGATYQGRKTGTLGDFSFFSLCRGKGLTIYEGGVIVTILNQYADIIDETIATLVQGHYLSESLKILELFGYWLFYRPALFWFVFNFPQLFWNLSGNSLRGVNEYFTIDFPIHKVCGFRKSVGHMQFSRLELEIVKQRKKASFYLDALNNIEGIKVIAVPQVAEASYPYLVLVFDELARRDNVLKALENSGLGASEIYRSAITDYDYLQEIIPRRDCPAGRFIARHHLALSTSTFLKEKDLGKIIAIIKKC